MHIIEPHTNGAQTRHAARAFLTSILTILRMEHRPVKKFLLLPCWSRGKSYWPEEGNIKAHFNFTFFGSLTPDVQEEGTCCV
mmetsp:Transcript_488/g.728  ORF Transcript_488/g.728 Transcript_488/m.728 type:complete len:82 (-) Transcript_488:764-1009(-)